MSITDQVIAIIVDQLGVEVHEVTPGASFLDDLGADSLDRIELTMACEEAFGIEIPDVDAEPIRQVGDLIAYLDQRTAAA